MLRATFHLIIFFLLKLNFPVTDFTKEVLLDEVSWQGLTFCFFLFVRLFFCMSSIFCVQYHTSYLDPLRFLTLRSIKVLHICK